jgi:hypothetical protein
MKRLLTITLLILTTVSVDADDSQLHNFGINGVNAQPYVPGVNTSNQDNCTVFQNGLYYVYPCELLPPAPPIFVVPSPYVRYAPYPPYVEYAPYVHYVPYASYRGYGVGLGFYFNLNGWYYHDGGYYPRGYHGYHGGGHQ